LVKLTPQDSFFPSGLNNPKFFLNNKPSLIGLNETNHIWHQSPELHEMQFCHQHSYLRGSSIFKKSKHACFDVNSVGLLSSGEGTAYLTSNVPEGVAKTHYVLNNTHLQLKQDLNGIIIADTPGLVFKSDKIQDLSRPDLAFHTITPHDIAY
jgi:hypothetical protein